LIKKMDSLTNRKKSLNSKFGRNLRLNGMLDEMIQAEVKSDSVDETELMRAENEMTWPRKFINNNNFKEHYQLEKRNKMTNQIDQKILEEYLRNILAKSLRNNNNYQEKKVLTQEELDNIEKFQRIIQSFGR